jgi:transcriptional regulator with XRE-family HTH domain
MAMAHNNIIKFRKNLPLLIEENKMDRKEFAKRLGTSPSTISKWILGKRDPSFEYLSRIMDILNCTFEELTQ